MDLALYTVGQDGAMTFGLSAAPGTVTGVQRLVQEAAVELLSDYSPETARGTDMLRNLGQIPSGDVNGATRIVTAAAGQALAAMRARTGQRRGTPKSERITDLRVKTVAESSSGVWLIALDLHTEAGVVSTTLTTST